MTRTAYRSLLVLVPIASLVALAGCGGDDGGAQPAAAATTTKRSNNNLITATGHGKVVGTPDVMTISLGVQTGGKTAQEALAENNTRANNLVNVIKERGVAPKDIQTSDLSVYPTFDLESGKINGFSAQNTVTAKLRKIGDAGGLIDAVTFAVGDAIRLNGISFSIDDTNALVAQARTDAVKKAMDQARQLAAGAGVRLGDVRTIEEVSERPVLGPVNYASDQAVRAAASAPVEAGSQDVTLDVKVVVEIAQ
jgi:uncharacterized protein YggE